MYALRNINTIPSVLDKKRSAKFRMYSAVLLKSNVVLKYKKNTKSLSKMIYMYWNKSQLETMVKAKQVI